MSISLDEVRHVARLARLEVDDHEFEGLQVKLNELLGHFEDIQHLDVSGQDPKPHAVSLSNVWAEDVPREGLLREDALRNAATTKAGLFIVPTIIEE